MSKLISRSVSPISLPSDDPTPPAKKQKTSSAMPTISGKFVKHETGSDADNNVHSAERMLILKSLKLAVEKVKGVQQTFNTALWAFCPVADDDCLRIQEKAPNMVPLIAHTADFAIDTWLRNGRDFVERKSLAPNAHVIREILKRDGNRCFLTGSSNVTVVSIYPTCLMHWDARKPGKVQTFFDFLKCFWDATKVEQWAQAAPYIKFDGTDAYRYYLTMSVEAQALFARGCFALKPLPLDSSRVGAQDFRVQFFWQPHYANVNGPAIDEMPQSSKGLSGYGNACYLARNNGGDPIRSGDIFTIGRSETERDAYKRAPSREMIEMQWYLNRVAGMARAWKMTFSKPAKAWQPVEEKEVAKSGTHRQGYESDVDSAHS